MSETMKWRDRLRPRIRSVFLAMLLVTLCLPLTGLFFFRVYENQLIHHTEGELISQAAVLAAVMARAVGDEGIPDKALGAGVVDSANEVQGSSATPDDAPFSPVEPSLDLASDPILPARQDGLVPVEPPLPGFVKVGAMMQPLIEETQRITLAGFRILDPKGTVIAGRGETGLSLAHVEEVATALEGRITTVMRVRVSDQPTPPVYSISRGTGIRIFLAFPVAVDGRVAGVIYASRTPANVVKHLYSERWKLLAATLTVIAAGVILAALASRLVTKPVRALAERSRRIAVGERSAMEPLSHHGTVEIAELADSFLMMARRQQQRSDQVNAFASHVSHELKSPLTAIQGAAELIRDAKPAMKAHEQRRFIGNIIADTSRMAELVKRLLELARAENREMEQASSSLAGIETELGAKGGLAVTLFDPEDVTVATSRDLLLDCLGNLADNSLRHGARQVTISARPAGRMAEIRVHDDGEGISPANRKRVFDPYFTTRRASGGTGMGLGITRALIENCGGTIELDDSVSGTAFLIRLPLHAERNSVI
ncbi:MAG: ATP-binding protein [Rhizobiaceae bacterium]